MCQLQAGSCWRTAMLLSMLIPSPIANTCSHLVMILTFQNAMTKLDAIIAENPGISLDELVATRKINNDQKAQATKKPHLQAQVSSLEAQLTVYRELEEAYEKKSSKDKASLLAAHADEIEKVRMETELKAKSDLQQQLRTQLLTFSQFLAAAANRRNTGEDDSEEGKAFEGALLLVYGGDLNAVEAAEKIIAGSEDKVLGVDGSPVNCTYARIKALSLIDMPPLEYEDTTTAQAPTSDPTITHAGLTELNDLTTAEITNGASNSSHHTSSAPANAGIDSGASNAAADAQWDPSRPGAQEDPMAESYEIVPRNPSEVDNPTPIQGISAQQSWSDEVTAAAVDNTWGENQPIGDDSAWTPARATQGNNTWPDSPPRDAVPTNGDDGFQEVRQHRGGRANNDRGDRGGRGRGGRGRGFRGGDRGGRGRGGPRGGRGRGESST
ncbi:hypothetical protein BT63DRAFT_194635 [Microthyrium microscopicum]|uniref:YAG7-like dimerisation domain-containing protein n=1 Tax=Microthyrium microscopicum TaxID=703497 RepID=A0A6A6ULM6_9PEZI|nr:hypothetical protein BT63DRAFT_194635 [Microthyrium microscopicum]